MNISQAINTIARYHEKAQRYSIRKRGNPPEVLRAFSVIRGGKFCECCGTYGSDYSERSLIQLHHLDGNWKNYKLDNLGFFCKQCHFDMHNGCWSTKPQCKEKDMTKMDWTGANGTTLILKTEEFERQGYSKEQAFREIEPHTEELFGRKISAESLSSTYHRVKRQRSPVDRSTQSARPQVSRTGLVMTIWDAYELHKFVREWGITVTK